MFILSQAKLPEKGLAAGWGMGRGGFTDTSGKIIRDVSMGREICITKSILDLVTLGHTILCNLKRGLILCTSWIPK